MDAPMEEQGNVFYGQQYGAPSQYGAMYDNGGAIMGHKGGGMFDGGKGHFLRSQRRRLNIRPVFLAALVPWALFSVVYAVLSFEIHYQEPGLCMAVIMAAFLLVMLSGLFACSASGRWFVNAEHEPTWLIFIFLSMVLAFVSAYSVGSMNFKTNMQPYYNMRNLNNYSDVSPVRMRGQQLMDAGIIEFAPGTKLDISKSMGFKNSKVYCVAPIVKGDDPLATYDFWAIGTDCCSGFQADFHCPHFNNPHANGGLRLMADGDRAFYRLAVQQAEATYNIKAIHPLFFEWSVDPMDMVEGWKHAGRSDYLVWMLSYFVFQAFLVAVAALAFAKMGFS